MQKFVEAYRAKMSKTASWLKAKGAQIRSTYRSPEEPVETLEITEGEVPITEAELDRRRGPIYRGLRAVVRAAATVVAVVVLGVLGVASLVAFLVYLVARIVFIALHLVRKVLSVAYLLVALLLDTLFYGLSAAKTDLTALRGVLTTWDARDGLDLATRQNESLTESLRLANEVQITVERVAKQEGKGRPTPRQRKRRPARIPTEGFGPAAEAV
jgi:hypothetical protein